MCVTKQHRVALSTSSTFMARCPHVQWVDLSGPDRDWSLTYAHRLRFLTNTLPNPDAQYPIFVFFYGRRDKTWALHTVFPNNNITRQNPHGIANLHLDVTTSGSDYPVFFADCSPDSPCTNLIGGWNGCHEVVSYPINHGDCGNPSKKTIVDRLHARLLFQFVGVVCVFADDLGGSQRTVERIRCWISARRPSGEFSHLPALVIFHTDPKDVEMFIQLECCDGFDAVFLSLSVFSLPPHPSVSPMAAEMTLRERLAHVMDECRSLRYAAGTLYSASHQRKFFSEAVKEFALSSEKCFDFVGTAVSTYNEHAQLTAHVSRFLSMGRQKDVPALSMARFLASALLVDCYPPGMHRMVIGILQRTIVDFL
jgi:hypothetical protein